MGGGEVKKVRISVSVTMGELGLLLVVCFELEGFFGLLECFKTVLETGLLECFLEGVPFAASCALETTELEFDDTTTGGAFRRLLCLPLD
jgi:hypothetical protein